ncbi:MAG: 50S ribosomal protein L4, partial [candidate division Zixibacteria bacterium]|nr:50S ribosomal protein L4 [candidate division Zixibacteria bacterium]
QNEKIVVIDQINLPEAKTKQMSSILDKLGLERKKCLLLDEGENRNLVLSLRNLQKVRYSRALLANTYDIVNADILLLTRAGLTKVEEVFSS